MTDVVGLGAGALGVVTGAGFCVGLRLLVLVATGVVDLVVGGKLGGDTLVDVVSIRGGGSLLVVAAIDLVVVEGLGPSSVGIDCYTFGLEAPLCLTFSIHANKPCPRIHRWPHWPFGIVDVL